MKYLQAIAIVFMLALPLQALAGDVNFIWEANVEPDLAGYRIYRSAVSGVYTIENRVLEILCGPNDSSCAKGTDVGVPNGEWFWVATAFDTEGFESDYSNEQTTIVTEENQTLRITGLN